MRAAALALASRLAAGLEPSCPPGLAPLGVDYADIKHYSGKVSCGNLFLEKDIGGGINVAPLISFPVARLSPDAHLAFLMIDPDGDMAGSWPDTTTPGPHAPVRHWVVGNIKAMDLLSPTNLSAADTLQPFKGPSPPLGSHRYGQFLFLQPKGKMEFKINFNVSSITQWDYEAFIADNGLGKPVGQNWHVTQHSD